MELMFTLTSLMTIMAQTKVRFDRAVEGATNIVDSGTEGTKVAAGTTAQRGSTTGQWRFNSTTGFFEGYDGTTFSTLDENDFGTVTGSGTHAKGSTHSNSSVCGSSAITAGKFTETLAQFGSPTDDFDSKADAPNINGTTASIFGYLVDSNEHRAENTGEVVKLEGLVTFADAVVVTADTTSLSMTFNVGEGMHLSESSGNKLFIGSGPFQAIMSAN